MKLGLCANPILFKTGFEESPYTGIGTGFLAKLGNYVFLVTARHVIKGCHPNNLCVFPNLETDEFIPFSDAFRVANPDPEDGDFSDIVLCKIDLEKLKLMERSSMTAIDLGRVANDWWLDPIDQRFIIFGYPNEARGIDLRKFQNIRNDAYCFSRI